MINRYLFLITVDFLTAASCLFFSFFLRFEFSIPQEFLSVLYSWILWFSIIQVIVFYFSDLYARIWRYTSLFDLYAIITSVAISSIISFLLVFFTMGTAGYPRSVLILYFLLNSISTTLTRLSVRVYHSHYKIHHVLILIWYSLHFKNGRFAGWR